MFVVILHGFESIVIGPFVDEQAAQAWLDARPQDKPAEVRPLLEPLCYALKA